MWYPIRTPAVFQWVYKSCIWHKSKDEPVVYLSFDDGPHPDVTPFVLDELRKWDAKASFFCIGENVTRYPDTFARIKAEGHQLGNHTFNHLNGWKTDDDSYLHNIQQAKDVIPSNLFRPPYGRIRFSQLKRLEKETDLKVIMWSLLSGDFDPNISPEQCTRNVVDHLQQGDVIVFHDSLKAKKNLMYTLPLVLKYIQDKGFACKVL